MVMTTEVLRNMLYAGSLTLGGLGYVVLDEVHYLADRLARRGLGGSHHPAARVGAGRGPVGHGQQRRGIRRLAGAGPRRHHRDRGRDRPVPLWQHMLAGRRLYDLFARNGAVNPELRRLAQRDQDADRDRQPAGLAAGGRRASGGTGRSGTARPAGRR